MNAKIISRLGMLAWTAAVAYFVYDLSSEPEPAPRHDSFYGDLGADLAKGATAVTIIFLVIFAWPIGLSLIWAAVRGCAALWRWHREAPERRQLKAERKARFKSPGSPA